MAGGDGGLGGGGEPGGLGGHEIEFANMIEIATMSSSSMSKSPGAHTQRVSQNTEP